MFSNEINILVQREQHRDRLRKVERQRLIRLARLQVEGIRPVHERTLRWIGAQMVKIGTRLQASAIPAAPGIQAVNRS